MKRKKILTLSDHPLSPSGVGTQTKYVIEALLRSDKYDVISLGGAVKHKNYDPQRLEEWGDRWFIYPVDGYGNQETIRSIMARERPDMVWFMTDPRFYGWLWEIENEIRAQVPLVYYHVWDNFPAPHFNSRFYNSTDEVVCISKVTKKILEEVAPEVPSYYLPHAVDPNYYYKYKKNDKNYPAVAEVAKQLSKGKKKLFFFNSRNARRKQSGTLIWWFKEFLDEVGHDKAMLLMHTDARDPHGQDLPHIIEHLKLTDGQVLLSTNKLNPEALATLYNVADYTVSISDAEGFGLSAQESLACGTPIIVTMTGGLQEQVTDGENWFGFGIEPAAKSVIGSLQVPYIYEDRITQKDFTETLKKAIKVSDKVYKKMSIQGRQHVDKNYNFEKFGEDWVKMIDTFIEEHGSWDTRTGYERWQLWEVA